MTLLLEHKPLYTRRGWPVIALRRNVERAYDGLPWLVSVECRCAMCRDGTGPGYDTYDITADGSGHPVLGPHAADVIIV